MRRLVSYFVCCFLSVVSISAQAVSGNAFDEETEYQKIFNALSRSGEANGVGDLTMWDQSQTDFIRGMICLNELTTDEAHCNWSDPGISSLNENTWDNSLPQADGMMARLQMIVYLCNRYLENAVTSRQRQAEVQFVRALMYYYMLDWFGGVPVTTCSCEHNLAQTDYDEYIEDGGEKVLSTKRPSQLSRAEVFYFIMNELDDFSGELAYPGEADGYRPDQVAADILRARMFLNAEVYIGEDLSSHARGVAKALLDDDTYTLADEYRKLFMADNDENGAGNEIVFALRQDGVELPTWSGTTYLVSACYSNWMPACGIGNPWAGVRARRQLVEKFSTGNTDIDDDRFMFYTNNGLDIYEPGNFSYGYGIMKYTNLRYDEMPASSTTYADTDFPLMRFAEVYLIFAEADARIHGGVCAHDGLEALNTLRRRAHAPELTQATLSDIADEWAREFYLEGRRRTDLIRFGLYTGSDYLWQWKGGTFDGQPIESWRTLFPLSDYFMSQREDYVQNEGYPDINKVKMAPEFTLDTPAFASSVVSLSDIRTMLFSWQRPDITDPYGYTVDYQLQLSPTGNFGEPTGPDDYVNWGVGYTTYIDMAVTADELRAEVDASQIDGILQAWKRVQRWSECPTEPIDVYFRCVAYLSQKQSVSNVVKVTVRPYCNNVNATNYYLVGAGIGDGNQTLTSEGIGMSMLPMDIDRDGYVCNWGGYGGDGSFELTTWLEKDKPFYIRQMSGIQVTTTDGTVEGAAFGNSHYYGLPTESQMFHVDESGWYRIRLKNSIQVWNGTEWVYEDEILRLDKVEAPATDVQQVTLVASTNIPLEPVAGSPNTLWRGVLKVSVDTDMHFDIDGVRFGGTGFSFGQTVQGGMDITVPKGRYIVTLNAATGFYDFYDINDAEFVSANRPGSLMYASVVTPVQDEDFIVTASDPVDTSEEWVQVCRITSLPSGLSSEGLRLVVGGTEIAMDSQLRVRSSQLLDAIAQSGGAEIDAYICGTAYTDGLGKPVASNQFCIAIIFPRYYLVGGLNGWDLSDSTFPLQTTDGIVYTIDIDREAARLAHEQWGILLISQQAHDNSDWNSPVFRSQVVVDDYSGYFATEDEGGWGNITLAELPANCLYYHLEFNFKTRIYTFTPIPFGDINTDGRLSVADLTALISIVNSGSVSYNSLYDVNQDGLINTDDIRASAEIIVGR